LIGDNVLLDRDQNVKLTDVGLATDVSADLVSNAGCPPYSSMQKFCGQPFGAEDDM